MDKLQLKKLTEMLPKKAGISGEEEFLNTSVLVLLANINNEYHFVFEKRAKQIKNPGEICFPGGKVDYKKDKNTEETAIRETYEEIGIEREKLNIIGRLDSIVSPRMIMVNAYLAIVNIKSMDEFHINKEEVEEVLTIPVSYFTNIEPEKYKVMVRAHSNFVNEKGEQITLLPAKEIGLPSNYNDNWGEGMYSIYVYKTTKEIIWGITARLVYDIVKKLH